VTDGLLHDVRVLDLTDNYGAYASRLLADLGAEVVRIEPADGGRGRTRWPRAQDGTSLHHLHRNAGKQIIALEPGPHLDGLLAGADIVFSTDPTLLDRHPHLVVVAVSPYGITGPFADRPATELVAQSLAGVVYRSGVPELPPVAAPGSYCEDVGSALGAVAALLALRQVRQGGPGQLIDVSAILALAQCTEMSMPLWSQLGMHQVRNGAGLYPLFECQDGLARIVLPMSPGEWRHLIEWLGSPPEWTGPAWEQSMLGVDEREQILARLPERFAAGTREQLAAEGDASGVRITPVLTPAEVLTNEHVEARGTFASIEVDGRTGKVPAAVLSVNGQRSATVAARTLDAPPTWQPRPVSAGTPAAPYRPLEGIRVLEIGSGVAAPEAGRVLGEWGADVIKVESAKHPDFQRRVLGSDMNSAFATVGRNKRLLAADLGTDAGRQLVRDLIPHVDVLIENNAAGVLGRLGLGWETLHELNPRLVLVGTQLYGDRGPWATKKGYGPSARAIGGLTWLWAHGPDEPRGVMTIYPDHLAGRLVALGALAGLDARERTGAGSRVDLAQFEAVAALLGDLLLAESLTPGAAQPVGNTSTEHAPWGVFRCSDDEADAERWLALCVPDDAAWAALVGVAPQLDRAEWQTEAGRLAAVPALEAAVGEWLRESRADETEDRLQRAGVPAGEATFPRLQAEHPFFVARGYSVEVEQPGCGRLLFEGPALAAPQMGTPRCDPAPMPGQHTVEICKELLGLDGSDIEGLVAAGALDPLPE
jgi:crotonobetainyl-CoA:carnitine CoA-transferase CaiB-like acyl-CoA transferase